MRRSAIVLLLGLAGCQCQPGASPDLLRVDVPHFEPTLLGATTARTVTFINDGDAALSVTELEVTPGGAFSLVGGPALDVPARGTAVVELRFAPTQLGPHPATLRFRLAPEADAVLSPVSAVGIGPVLSLRPAAIDLGTLVLDEGRTVEAAAVLTVENVGQGADLHVSFVVDDPSGALCVGDCAGGEVRVPAAGLAQVPVRFTASTVGARRFDVRLSSNDVAQPMTTVAVTANVVARPTCRYTLAPAALDFGVLPPPESRTLAVRFENVGELPCTLSTVVFVATPISRLAPEFRLAQPALPIEVAPGTALDLEVTAADPAPVPFVPRDVTGQMRLAVQGRADPATVSLRVRLDRPCVVVTPEALDFGIQPLGCAASQRTLTVYNFCAGPVTVTAASVPAPFSMSVGLPAALAPGATLALPVSWLPAALGTARAQVTVQWDEGTRVGRADVPALGSVVTGTGREVYPAGQAQVDLLLVFDDSCSMQAAAMDATAKLQALLPALDARPVDYRVGVIRGSSPYAPLQRASDGTRWVSRTTPDGAARFRELLPSTFETGLEAGEDAVLNALTPPWAVDPLRNGGFLRPKSQLSVVTVADHGDSQLLLTQVLALRPAGMLRWDAFLPTGATTCAYSPVPANSGSAAYTAATGGRYVDLCAPSWTQAFTELAGWSAARTVFPLTGAVAPQSTLSVEVSGTSIPSTTPQGAVVWTWEPQANAVRFESTYAPGVADTVVVTYSAVCAP